MYLRGIDFGHVWDASGVRGFFGEGYKHHKVWRHFGLDFSGSTFVAKTTTLNARAGHMPLRKDFTPKEIKPKCIVVNLRKGVALNSVALSGPGGEALLATGKWQARTDNFFISFMSVAQTPDERIEEFKLFAALLKRYQHQFCGHFGLQINMSCPNVSLHGQSFDEVIAEAYRYLDIAAQLDVPLVLKFNVLLPTWAAKLIADHKYCDALCVSNTLPWGALPNKVNWKELFGSDESPLAHLGGGGLSGKPLLLLGRAWLEEARKVGIKKPINAGGGILGPNDIFQLFYYADSIFIGSMTFLRPWRVGATIRQGIRVFGAQGGYCDGKLYREPCQ